MKHGVMVALALLLSVCWCNVWDNVYSQLQADTPIQIKQSLNFDIQIPQYTLVVNIDYSQQLRLLTAIAQSRLGPIKVTAAKAQLDLATLIITEQALNSGRCHRYQHQQLTGIQPGQGVGKDRLFLINLLFRFIKRQGSVDIYQLEPILIKPSQKQLDNIEKQAKSRAQERGREFDIDLQEPQIDLWVHVDVNTGSIRQIFTGQEGETSVPFKAESHVEAAYHCSSPLQIITNQDIVDSLQRLAPPPNGQPPNPPDRRPPSYHD